MLKFNLFLELKHKSKNPLLVQVWHRDRAYPISLACYESVVYGHIDVSVFLSFSCSGFVLLLFCRCVLPLSPGVSRFLRSTSLGQGGALDR
jgi:hypothetical protein